jgi:hypothetical protein
VEVKLFDAVVDGLTMNLSATDKTQHRITAYLLADAHLHLVLFCTGDELRTLVVEEL